MSAGGQLAGGERAVAVRAQPAVDLNGVLTWCAMVQIVIGVTSFHFSGD